MPIYRDIPGFPWYKVSETGEVKSYNHGEKQLTKGCSHRCTNSYYGVGLYVNGKRVYISVHKLVALAWLPPKPAPHYVLRHLDGNGLNNDFKNLCWGTQADNSHDSLVQGRRKLGENHSHAKLTNQAVTEIMNSSEEHCILAERFGVSASAISHVKTGRSWAHLTQQKEERNEACK